MYNFAIWRNEEKVINFFQCTLHKDRKLSVHLFSCIYNTSLKNPPLCIIFYYRTRGKLDMVPQWRGPHWWWFILGLRLSQYQRWEHRRLRSHSIRHGRMNYRDNEPYMSAFLSNWPVNRLRSIVVFNRFYRLEIHSLMIDIFEPACETLLPWMKELYLCTVAPLSSLWPPPLPPFPN